MISPSEASEVERGASGRFQVLALSGGGYRGLYTAKVISDLEDVIGEPIGTRFDLIAGTSVGGILALALALEIPASRVVDLFVNHGSEIFAKRRSLLGILRAPYSSDNLRALLAAERLFGDRLLGACKHPVIVPSINYSTGELVLFKTAHEARLTRDYKMPLIDAALATSAAPAYFPRHTYANSQYVDGGLVANHPGVLALHEANKYFLQEDEAVHLLSVGTMSTRSTVDPRRRPNGGHLDWGNGWPTNAPRKIFDLSISVQESMSGSMLEHRLGLRYVRIDDQNSPERARAVGLDRTDRAAQQALLSAAEQRSKQCTGDAVLQEFLKHKPRTPTFFHGALVPR